MSYLFIGSFKYGLDTRKSELTQTLGTLQVAENCHINGGGEAEKRKAFVGLNDTVGRALANSILPANVFGAEPGLSTIYVFGSIATPGGLPTGTTYIRCQSPQGGSMTSVVNSCSYAGLPFVIATFNDSGTTNTYAFYNGSLVRDMTSGVVLANLAGTGVALATDFATLFPNNGYTATYPGGSTFDAYVYNAPGTQYKVNQTLNSASGTLTVTEIAANVPAIPAGQAVGQFTIQSGDSTSASNLISSVRVGTGVNSTSANATPPTRSGYVVTVTTSANHNLTTGDYVNISGFTQNFLNVPNAQITKLTNTTFSYTTLNNTIAISNPGVGTIQQLKEILNVNVLWTVSNTQTAIAVASQINTYQTAYRASTSGSTVYIASVSATAGSLNGYLVQATSSGNVCIGDCLFSFTQAGGTPSTLVSLLNVEGVDISNAGAGSTWSNDLPTTIAKFANYINGLGTLPLSYTSITLPCSYVAYASGATMRIARSCTTSNDPSISVNITPASFVNINFSSGQAMTAYVPVTSVGGASPPVLANGKAGTYTAQAQATVQVSGGVPFIAGLPYTYQWQAVPGGNPPGTGLNSGLVITLLNANTANVTFQLVAQNITYPFSYQAVGQFVCVATDSVGNVVTSAPVSVTLLVTS
jgi:hypothetical protein